MRFKILVQTFSDVITNSSSEIYTIKSDIGVDYLREWWDNKLRSLGYSEEEIKNDDTIGGDIYSGENCIVLSYAVMCNVSENILKILASEFGEFNINYYD